MLQEQDTRCKAEDITLRESVTYLPLIWFQSCKFTERAMNQSEWKQGSNSSHSLDVCKSLKSLLVGANWLNKCEQERKRERAK